MLIEFFIFFLGVILSEGIYRVVEKAAGIKRRTVRFQKMAKWLTQGLLFIGLIVTAAMLGWID